MISRFLFILILALLITACGKEPEQTITADQITTPNPSTNTVEFVNGLWKPNLSDAVVGVASAGWYHNGLRVTDDYIVNGSQTSVRETQKADGSTGKVITVYYGTERNQMTAPITLTFNSPQTEFWLRFKYRIAAGRV